VLSIIKQIVLTVSVITTCGNYFGANHQALQSRPGLLKVMLKRLLAFFFCPKNFPSSVETLWKVVSSVLEGVSVSGAVDLLVCSNPSQEHGKWE